MAAEYSMKPWTWILAALLLLILPLPWVIAAFLAALFHELCHILAIAALGGRYHGLSLGNLGAEIKVSGLSWGRELLAAAAGPAGSFLLLLLIHRFPRLGLCGLMQGFFNLIPIYPSDGGRILLCLLSVFLGPVRGEALTEKIGTLCRILILLAGIFFSIYPAFHLRPLIFAGLLARKREKTPCKEAFQAVQ